MASTINVGVLRALLTVDSAQFEAGLREASGSVKKFESEARKLGQNLSTIGTQMTAMVTLPIVAAFGSAAKAAIDFESSFAGVRKTVDASEPEFQAMAQQFRDLAKTIPVNVNDLNRLGEAAGALGIPKEEIVDFAKVMAELGVTTNVTADMAAESIAKIQNIFGASGKATENFASALVDLGNKGASTEQEILALATRVASAGNTIGLSQAQVLGWSAALANVGLEAEAGGSAISRIFVDISKAASIGGKEVEKFATVAGMSAEAFSKLFKKDANAAMIAFVEGLGKIKTSGQDLNVTLEKLGFTELRQSDTLRRLAGDATGVAKAVETSSTAWRENSALSVEAGKRFETTASQMTLLWNRIKDVGITIGNALLPAIKFAISLFDSLIPYLEMAANLFAAMPGPLQAVVLGFFAIVAAAGPVLFLFGQMALGVAALTGVGGFSGLIAMIGKVVGGVGLGGLTAALRGSLGALTTWSGVWGLITGAVTGFLSVAGRVVAFFTSWSTVVAGATGALGLLRAAFAFLTGPIGLTVTALTLLGPALWSAAGGWDGIKAALAPIGALFSDLAVIVKDWASRTLTYAIDRLAAFYQWLVDIKNVIPGWGEDVKTEIEEPTIGLGAAWDNMKRLASQAFGGVREEIRLTAQAIKDVQAILEKIAPDHKKIIEARDAALKQFEAKPITLGLELPKSLGGLGPLEKIPKTVGDINALLKDTTKETDAAKKAAQAADEAHREWKRTVAANEKVFQQQAKEAEKFFAQERKLAENKADEMLRSFNAAREAERELTKVARDASFERAEFAIEMAKRQGATWQDVYAMETELSEARLQAAIDDAELEFEIRTMWIDRTTQFGAAEYERLKQVHDAKIRGMVDEHQRAEFIKRDELDKTHNVWRRSMDGIRDLWRGLSTTISDHLTKALMHATSFKDAFVGIWQSIKQSLLGILGDILNSFVKTFLDGMLGAIMGRQGAFSSAFGGLFSGMAGAGGPGGGIGGGLAGNTGLIGALGGLFGIGGANSAVAGVLAGNAGIAGAMAGAGGAGAGAAAGAGVGGAGGSALAALMTNPWTIGIAAAIIGGLTIWKTGFGRGGEEGTQVNPARDEFFAGFQQQFGGTQFDALAQAFASKGVSGDIAERLIADLYAADSMDEFRRATEAINRALAEATGTTDAAAAAAEVLQASLTQFEQTVAQVAASGQVSDSAINALRISIAGLSASNVSADVVGQLNTQLTAMVASGTASDEAIAGLISQIEQLTAQAGPAGDAAAAAAATSETAAGMVEKVGAALNQFQATVSSLQMSGMVSGEAIAALREAITDLKKSNVSAEVIEKLNDTLTQMIAEGTASDEAIGDLVTQIEAMTESGGDLETQAGDTTDATKELERWQYELEGQLGYTGDMTSYLKGKMGEAEGAASSFASELDALRAYLSQPIHLPDIHMPNVIGDGDGGGGGGTGAPPGGGGDTGGGGETGGGDTGGGDPGEYMPPPLDSGGYGFWEGPTAQQWQETMQQIQDMGIDLDAPWWSFANEGIVSKPTMAIVGDAKEPEWILRQSSVMDLFNEGFSFGASMLDALTNSLPSFGDMDLTPALAAGAGGGGGDINVTAKIAVHAAPGEDGPSLARRLVTALPQALRHDDGFRQKIRRAVR